MISNTIESTAQIALDKIYETSKRTCRCFPHLTSKVQKMTFMNCMKDIRKITDRLFTSGGMGYMEALTDISEMERTIRALERHVPSEGATIMNADYSTATLDVLFDDESNIAESRDTGYGAVIRTLQKGLSMVILHVKEWELKYYVQEELWKAKKQLSCSLGKSSDQFTYGSTSFSFWKELCCSECWRSHILKYVQNAGHLKGQGKGLSITPLRVCIFGSSQGLLGIFTQVCVICEFCRLLALRPDLCGSLVLEDLSVEIQGFEVMPLLYQKSVEMVSLFPSVNEQQKSKVLYYLQDMLTASCLGDMDIVVLTSLCWDTSTRNAVGKKLHSEMRPGALVVEYTPDLFKAAGVDADNLSVRPSVEGGDSQGPVPRASGTSVGATDTEKYGAQCINNDSVFRLEDILLNSLNSDDAMTTTGVKSLQSCTDNIALHRLHLLLNEKASTASAERELVRSNPRSSDGMPNVYFKLASILQGECTWNSEQKLFLFETVT